MLARVHSSVSTTTAIKCCSRILWNSHMEVANKETSLLTLLKSLQTRRDALAKSLEVLDAELQAVTTTIRLLRNGHLATSEGPVNPYVHNSPRLLMEADDVRGMTQIKAVISLALQSNGRVKIVEARKALEKVGKLKRSKNGYNILYNVITKSNKFEHCGPGEYKLLPEYEEMINRVVAGESPRTVINEVLSRPEPPANLSGA
jgi:hypothetical protein